MMYPGQGGGSMDPAMYYGQAHGAGPYGGYGGGGMDMNQLGDQFGAVPRHRYRHYSGVGRWLAQSDSQ